MKIKVCILTSVHSSFDVRIFHKEAKSLVKAGYDVTLIAQHDKEEVVDGVKIINLQKPRNRIERMTKTVWSAYRKAVQVNADIYHFHDPELMPIGFLLKCLGKKVIYDMHENLPKQIMSKHWINPRLRYPVSKLMCFAERILLHGTPIIFAEQSYHKDYQWVKDHETVLNFPIFSLLSCIASKSTEKDIFALGYLGGVSEARGSVLTLEALKILKARGIAPYFECIGPISETHKKELLKKCEDYKLSNVKFYGYLPMVKGWAVMKRCGVGLALLHPIPNYYESYPTKLFEYMAMGIPVITSNFPLYRSIIEGNECGLCVYPLNPSEIAEAIQWMIEHPDEAKAMGENGRRAVEEKYNWENEEKKLLELYAKLSDLKNVAIKAQK